MTTSTQDGVSEWQIEYAISFLNALANTCHSDNKRWWLDVKGMPFDKDDRVTFASKIALIHSEVSEMLEGLRKGKPDEHLPHRSAEEVECADILIRVFDYAAARGLDISGAFAEKREFNLHREDHKPAARKGEHGKKF